MGQRQDQNSVGQTLNLVQAVARCESDSSGTASGCSPHGFSLGPALLTLVAFLRGATLLASPTFWSLYCTFNFTLIASHTVF